MTGTQLPRLIVVLALLAPSLARAAHAQGEYRNLDAGLPVRVEDATVAAIAPQFTARYPEAARYRDSTTSITSFEEWKSRAESMGVTNMGGPAPVTGGR